MFSRVMRQNSIVYRLSEGEAGCRLKIRRISELNFDVLPWLTHWQWCRRPKLPVYNIYFERRIRESFSIWSRDRWIVVR
jgi:hypothetical protein